MGNDLHVLVVDDEPLARKRLVDLIEKANRALLVGTATTGREGVEAIKNLDPDLVFLDVQMPGLTGLEVVQEIGPSAMPATIFVTAFDQHALAAFDVAAIDYLLKPFEDERFTAALERARHSIRLQQVDELQSRLAILLGSPSLQNPTTEPSESAYLERIAVDSRGQIRIVPVEEIDFISADGPYAEIHTGKSEYVVRERMKSLEDRLNPAHFVRIHRSTIVQIDRIETLLVAGGGDYAVKLKDGRRLRVSRKRRDVLAERLGISRKDD